MQANCPNCSQVLVVDDAKVPAGPFMLKCPKCEKAMRLPGKGGAAGNGGTTKPEATAKPATAGSTPAPQPSAPQPPPPTTSTPPMAGPPSQEGTASGRAMVSLVDGAERGALSDRLRRLGYEVDEVADPAGAMKALEQNRYALIATTKNGKPADLYGHLATLVPEQRREVFLVLVGPDFQTGDVTQAFTVMADFVVNSKDVETADSLLQRTVREKAELYQAYLEAVKRAEERKF